MINKNSRILITGGKGFLGRYVERELRRQDYSNVFTASGVTDGLDLGEEANVGWLFDYTKPDYVVHLACRHGGMGANFRYSGGLMYENLNMSIKIIEEARQYDVKKIVNACDISCYPARCPMPFRETDFWEGYPHFSKGHYSVAKKTIADMLVAYKRQFGMNTLSLIFSDIYGPEDEFDPHAGKIIPALLTNVRFALENDLKDFNVDGSSKSTRDFIYVEDCAKAVVLALENDVDASILNVGSGEETTIKDLVSTVCDSANYIGKIEWNETKAKGVERRCLDITGARQLLSFEPQTKLKDGIDKTLDWFYKAMQAPSQYAPDELPPSLRALR